MIFQIELNKVEKRFQYDRIFTDVNWLVQSRTGNYAILGHNGSGKSTLMKILSGHLTPSAGQVTFKKDAEIIEINKVYTQISYVAPYIDLIEEFTLREAIAFHQNFKPFQTQITTHSLIEDILTFKKYENKFVKHFSSGMKQRLKLALAIAADTPVLLLDEPTSHLDEQGIGWYHQLIQKYATNKLVIVASNAEQDYLFCQHRLDITAYKNKIASK